MRNKQRAFIEEYFKDWNATQAALRAGYSPRSAYSIGQENLKKPEIAVAIKQRIDEKAMSADEVLSRLAEHARGDMGDFLDIGPMGFEIDLDKAKELGITHLIKKARMKTIITMGKNDQDTEIHDMEIELYDAQAALVHLGRHHALFTDNTSTDITSGGKPIFVDVGEDIEKL